MISKFRVLICAAVLPFLSVSCKAVLSEKELDSILTSRHATLDSINKRLDSLTKWQIVDRVDHMDDRRTVYAAVVNYIEDSDDETVSVLKITCDRRRLHVHLLSTVYLENNKSVYVRYDSTKAFQQAVSTDDDREGMAWPQSSVKGTLSRLRNSDSVRMRFGTLSYGVATKKFMLGADGRQAIDSVMSACGVRS